MNEEEVRKEIPEGAELIFEGGFSISTPSVPHKIDAYTITTGLIGVAAIALGAAHIAAQSTALVIACLFGAGTFALVMAWKLEMGTRNELRDRTVHATMHGCVEGISQIMTKRMNEAGAEGTIVGEIE